MVHPHFGTLLSNLKEQAIRQRIDLWWPRGKRVGGGIDWELEVSRCKLLLIEWINSKVLLYSTGNYIQYPVKNHSGKEHKKERVCVCVCV